MRTVLALQVATLLSLSIPSMAATVEYQHPNLTIVAKDEPLDSVLKSLGKEMRIFVTTPSGLNPVVNCDIQDQPIKLALKKLLGDMSYSLEWEEKTDKLVGLTILAGGEGAAGGKVSAKPAHTQSVSQANPVPVASTSSQSAGTHVAPSDHAPPMAEHEARMETDRAEHEARMVGERAAQEERMKAEAERAEAEMAAYLESQGLQPPQ